ncbi:MAG TPA: nitrate/sulfonate/bicarbonate ABC transporter ATP-binding protein [Candidatus Kapabacteria bacterium]|nr:nitrate/sulfonate/bicarbonate ABC transporter ATP-binding protein [Candidatus Kapabacteria bacterium]
MTTTTVNNDVMLSAGHVTKRFPLPEGNGAFTVLDDVSITVRTGEVVALLGRSGSGKSTLLRILAGLIPPTSGEVISSGKPLDGPNPDVAMVFQSFALLPWLTVQQNVELGLHARGVDPETRRTQALKAIDMVGLDGFESAFPKELSGGMRQRVGFARAFVVQPNILFMDEPFSALDVLTAENLRSEIGSLWHTGTFPARSILIVTHNIEESVMLSDRIVILGANPGIVRGEIPVNLPWPRDRSHPEFQSLVDHIYAVMTNPGMPVTMETPVLVQEAKPMESESPYRRRLPHARAGGISGLLQLLVERGGASEIASLAGSLHMDVDTMLPTLDAAVMLGFVEISRGRISVTPDGHDFAVADILRSKELFRQHVLDRAPLVLAIYETLITKHDGGMRGDFFVDFLDEHYSDEEARRQFETAVDWGRYAELFEYDAHEDWLSLAT